MYVSSTRLSEIALVFDQDPRFRKRFAAGLLNDMYPAFKYLQFVCRVIAKKCKDDLLAKETMTTKKKMEKYMYYIEQRHPALDSGSHKSAGIVFLTRKV